MFFIHTYTFTDASKTYSFKANAGNRHRIRIIIPL